ncbi:hypothetical protein PE066_19115 [Ramlibacter tataouinensis]|uniref:hypothetical protein n=1 Tax=Ramlibacter tataouinensis TaxID=94132 RepID=UPI0022F3AE8B|nr:hypothetical protein [Ramlibacter tataouinensis]WBY01549.1 hypothetical protein PE066_19115 [Ramlibacter tataouinensis]
MNSIISLRSDLFVAGYTVRTREGHMAHCKICASRPLSAWDSTPGVQIQDGPFLEEVTALAIVFDRAKRLARPVRLARRRPRPG